MPSRLAPELSLQKAQCWLVSHLFGSSPWALRGTKVGGPILVLSLHGLGSAQSLAALSLAQLKVQRSPLGT